jgi:hypothetical protein
MKDMLAARADRRTCCRGQSQLRQIRLDPRRLAGSRRENARPPPTPRPALFNNWARGQIA